MRCQQHLGGQLKFSLITSNVAFFFFGVSRPRSNIGISALLFFVPIRAVNHAHISAGSLLYQVGLARVNQRTILRDAAQASLFHRLNFVAAQTAVIASFVAAHNK